ncbi:MAG TPA: endo-1,4-beta-xylanase, partial [Pseudonocardiaceae bacterium]|nr:endo-1,4-beta-xylanase [Pseudonocardiaceae bacterium]
MKLRSLAVAAFGAALLATGSTAFASVGTPAAHPAAPPADSLRALAAQVGLRVGTAIIPFDLDNPGNAQIAADQFSVVTPGNEMKW